MFAQSVAAMTINRSCALAGHGRSITSESSVTPNLIDASSKIGVSRVSGGFTNTVEPLLYDHPQIHIGVVV